MIDVEIWSCPENATSVHACMKESNTIRGLRAGSCKVGAKRCELEEDNWELRAGSCKVGAESCELEADNWELGTGSCAMGAQSWGLRAGGYEL